jgi:rod shape-determining protein MreD
MTIPNRKVIFWVILLVLFMIQSSLFFWVLPGEWAYRVAPHLVLVSIVVASLFVHRYFAMSLGLVFGFLHDLQFYGHMLGLFTFVMGLTGYLTGMAFQRKHMTFFYVAAVVGISCLSFDTLVYMLYALFQVASSSYLWALLHYILPSLFINLLFFTVMYIPLRQYAEAMAPEPSEEES